MKHLFIKGSLMMKSKSIKYIFLSIVVFASFFLYMGVTDPSPEQNDFSFEGYTSAGYEFSQTGTKGSEPDIRSFAINEANSQFTFRTGVVATGSEGLVYYTDRPECEDDDFKVTNDYTIDTVKVEISKDGNLFKTVYLKYTGEKQVLEYDKNKSYQTSLRYYETKMVIGSQGNYSARVIATDDSITSTGEIKTFEVNNTLSGKYFLNKFTAKCSSTDNPFVVTDASQFGNSFFSISADGKAEFNADIKTNVDTTAYPCLKQSYSFDESGTLSILSAEQLQIEYKDSGNIVKAKFGYTFDGTNLKLTYIEDGELIEFYFSK